MTETISPKATKLGQEVAAEIRSWMGRLNVRQSQLARRLGEKDQWLSMRLLGRRGINMDELGRIAEALDVGVVDLLPASARTSRGHNITLSPNPDARTRRPGDHRPPSYPGHAAQPSAGTRTRRLPQ